MQRAYTNDFLYREIPIDEWSAGTMSQVTEEKIPENNYKKMFTLLVI